MPRSRGRFAWRTAPSPTIRDRMGILRTFWRWRRFARRVTPNEPRSRFRDDPREGVKDRISLARVAWDDGCLRADRSRAVQLHIRPNHQRVAPLWARTALAGVPVRRFPDAAAVLPAR